MNVTLIIPTYNRTPYLARLLSYYHQKQCTIPIVIADSSAQHSLLTNQKVVADYRGKLNLNYREFASTIRAHQKLTSVLTDVKTEFTVICPDDDFIIPSSIYDCVTFLADHPDYSVTRGYACWIVQPPEEKGSYPQDVSHRGVVECVHALEKQPDYYKRDERFTVELSSAMDGEYPPLHFEISRYEQQSAEESDVSERLVSHLGHYTTTFYSVHRTGELRNNLNQAVAQTDEGRFGELLPSCLSVIQGKVRRLDNLFMVREWQPNSGGATNPELTDLLLDDRYSARYASFRDVLSGELTTRGNRTFEENRNIVNRAFLPYLGSLFAKKRIGLNI